MMIDYYFIALIVLRSTPASSCPTGHASSSSNPTGPEQIDHADLLVNDISSLYLNEKFSDVVLVVDNEEFHAHRIVLASRSDYFSVSLYGGYIESHKKKVPIKEGSATSVKVLLQYIYSGRMDLSILESKVILELLILSNVYRFTNLQFSLCEYLRGKIDVHNVSTLFAVALYYQIKELEIDSLNYIDSHALDVLQSEDSLSLTYEALLLILNRDTAYANELDIFRAVCRWIKKNQDHLVPGDKTKILSAIRYELMDDEELSEVRQSELVSSDRNILDVIKLSIDSLPRELNNRGRLEPNVNFAVGPPNKVSQIDGGTMIVLNHLSTLNYIEMELYDEQAISYTYYIEVSKDRLKWLRVIDHSNYHCRSIQRLWTNRILVRYIRIVGTNNTSNKTFSFLKVMYNTDKLHLVEIKNGLVAPKYNVALPSMGLAVNKRQPDCLQVQLAQPYVLSSMRILLNDGNSRTCGYIIHVSVNNEDWELIVDNSKKPARSWQLFKFDPTPIVYIRISAVRTSKKDELIKSVHLVTPAPVSLDSDAPTKQSWSIIRLLGRK
ncbi:BTB/POZ domain-containing protein 9-like isoform X3 [Adelges cooleyi]|uniref:BTB/POZ domain-containing protein 9-like isoform X3 n=1 Tax=Adelges cooleyi TaxID=133065 RepID=UPI00217FB51C|nr:BTB/POZ domain-containing protein 9-like isoform X3 [Adelges cooleyi]